MARRVDLKDQSPLIIKAEDLTNGSCAVCRCGLSGHWPMCDGTHKATIGEEPGKLYRYERELPQGTVKRTEVGDLEMPGDGQKRSDPTVDEAGPHEGAATHRPKRPERGVAAEGTRGNAAGTEGKSGQQAASGPGDELLATPGGARENESATAARPLATGGAEGILPKNRSGEGGESA